MLPGWLRKQNEQYAFLELWDLYTETATKEFVKKYRPVRQRTVREESTKDNAGALPPAVYTRQQDFNKVDLTAGLGNDFNIEDPVGFNSKIDEEEALQATSEGWGCDRRHICRRLSS